MFFIILKVKESLSTSSIRGTVTYIFQDGGQDKLDFKIVIQSSKFMVPCDSGLTELLTEGALEHASSVTKNVKNSNFDQILSKLSMNLNFAVVEQVDNSAYMYAKSVRGQHSVAFLIKLNNEKLSVEGKSTEPTILASLTDEIRDMKF